MRALVVSIWVFINLVFFGMCGYMYLLWSQYWMYMDKQADATTSTYDQQIYFYNRGYLPIETNRTHNNNTGELKARIKHSLRDNGTVTLIKNSKPRFPNLQGNDFELDTRKYVCWRSENASSCSKKSSEYKEKLMKELRRVLAEESNILKSGRENPYNVQFRGLKGDARDQLPEEVLCQLKKVKIESLKKKDVRVSAGELRDFLPKRGLFDNKNFNSCAIIASAGALRGSNLGKTIDSYDLVLRFNHAPVKGYEEDVGRKTTIRVLNSQVVTKEEFKFLHSDIYRNVTILAWDPSNYTASVNEWIEKPEFNLFPNYVEYRKKFAKSKLFLLKPRSLWNLWNFLQNHTSSRLRRNPPSSGFLGLGILLPFCNYVDMFEYVPSVRVSKRCHYYDVEENPACTFGVWHPLAAEKLLTYHINSADDVIVFQKGYVRVIGFRNLRC